jgi:3-oxoadipate enol-lactonase
MAFTEVKGGGRIHYELTGPSRSSVFVLSNSLGTNFSMWDPQISELNQKWRVLRYDTRGHGQSAITPGPYSMAQLGRDVLDLLGALNVATFAFCGLSMGGMIGMWLAVHAPERLQKLVLCSTAAKIGTAETWNARIETVRKGGMKSIATATMERWFTARFRSQRPDTVERIKQIVERANPEGYIACCGALRDCDLRDSISGIRTPTLVISATHDPATPPSDGRFLSDHIRGARYIELDAAHLSNIEQPAKFTVDLVNFLSA